MKKYFLMIDRYLPWPTQIEKVVPSKFAGQHAEDGKLFRWHFSWWIFFYTSGLLSWPSFSLTCSIDRAYCSFLIEMWHSLLTLVERIFLSIILWQCRWYHSFMSKTVSSMNMFHFLFYKSLSSKQVKACMTQFNVNDSIC